MFESFLQYADNIKISEEDVSFERAKFLTSHMSSNMYNSLVSISSGQPFIKNPEYSTFTYNFEDDNLELVTSFQPDGNDVYFPMNLNILDDRIVSDCLDIIELMNYLYNCQHLKMVLLPIDYSCDIINAGHVGMLAIYIDSKEVYCVDPNGFPSYFNNILKYNVTQKIESMFAEYFSLAGYHYKKTDEWNQHKIAINIRYDNNFIKTGNCVASTIMLGHLLCVTELTPKELYLELKKLSNDEMKVIIFKYTTIMYFHIITNSHTGRHYDNLYNRYLHIKNNIDNKFTIEDFMALIKDMHANYKNNYVQEIDSAFGYKQLEKV